VIVIAGPTAVGKTRISLELAEKLGGEIVSADSRQVYRFMDIGTAKPSPEDMRRIPHHMIDVVNPDEEYTVADYGRSAHAAIKSILERGKIPIMVGGSGLYIRAVIDGIFPGPGSDKKIRENLEKEAEINGLSSLYDRLCKVDPAASSRIHPNDKRRIIRALEIYEITGKPISLLQEKGKKKEASCNTVMIGLNRPREELYGRIEERVEEIFRQGFVEEVKALLDKGYEENLISMEALGYREVIKFLKGEIGLEPAKRKVKQNTCHYAKRQLIWFRKDKRINWFNIGNEEKAEETAQKIHRNLNV
jgi:tRNA dimethylallyltransferase